MKKLVLFVCVLSTSFLMASGGSCGCGKNKAQEPKKDSHVQPKPAEHPAPAVTPTATDEAPAVIPASSES